MGSRNTNSGKLYPLSHIHTTGLEYFNVGFLKLFSLFSQEKLDFFLCEIQSIETNTNRTFEATVFILKLLFLKTFILFLVVFVSKCGYIHISTGAQGVHKRTLDPLGLELPDVDAENFSQVP